MGAEFLFMDDNARALRGNIVDECLQSKDITRMDWPAYSPDLNPIEHVWVVLGRRIAARQPPPTCLPELRRALLDERSGAMQGQLFGGIRTLTGGGYLDFLLSNNLHLCNIPGLGPTFMALGSRLGTPDLTLTSCDLVSFVENWEILSTESLSDHSFISVHLPV
ncbi:transposable element Tcb1 transposase [Trichonephila clavipes]|nr:transposable element Tcb1 transposase [Trichonephila clavipes]